MKYQQRDLVMLEATLTGKKEQHPFLIISCAAANQQEAEPFYTGVMITTSKKKDMFSFSIDDNMFEAPVLKHGNQARLYLITGFLESAPVAWVNRIKKPDFQNLLVQMKDYVLTAD